MPKNLLLADDSKTIQQAISMTFAREDVAVTMVGDGNSALQKAKQIQPDIILADVSMPGLGGYELCERVRADAALKNIPVLLLGGGNPVDPSKAIAVGANGHMPKPFDSGKLIEQVKQILANPRAAASKPPLAPAVSRPPAARPGVSAPPPAARPPAAQPEHDGPARARAVSYAAPQCEPARAARPGGSGACA